MKFLNTTVIRKYSDKFSGNRFGHAWSLFLFIGWLATKEIRSFYGQVILSQRAVKALAFDKSWRQKLSESALTSVLERHQEFKGAVELKTVKQTSQTLSLGNLFQTWSSARLSVPLFFQKSFAILAIAFLVLPLARPALADEVTPPPIETQSNVETEPILNQGTVLDVQEGVTVSSDSLPESEAGAGTALIDGELPANLQQHLNPDQANPEEDGTPDVSDSAPAIVFEDTTTGNNALCESNLDSPIALSEPAAPEGDPNVALENPDAQLTDLEVVAEDPDEVTAVPSELAGCNGQGGRAVVVADDDSQVNVDQTATQEVSIINTNDVELINDLDSEAVSGQNLVLTEADGQDVTVSTGDVNVVANVFNVENNNLTNSEIVELTETFNNLSNDVIMNQPEKSQAQKAQDLVSGICSESAQVSDNSEANIDCKSFSTFSLTNKNTANIENNVDATGVSGQNIIEGVEENANIITGDVNVIVNILNIVNINLYNSTLTIANTNIFGNFTGDVVLPSELYFTNFMSVGATDNSNASLDSVKKVVIDISNDNEADIENNVNINGVTGDNALIGTGTPAGTEGDVDDSEISSGDAQSGASVQTLANTNIINGKWYIGMVNALGSWSGNVYSLPNEVAMIPTTTGYSFFASTAENADGTYELLDDAILDASSTEETEVIISNENDAKIVNNVNIDAISGENGIINEEVEDSSVRTGNTLTLASILNIVNLNLINADVFIGVVNVLGTWDGNVVFGYPDLAVTQRMSGNVPSKAQDSARYTVNYANTGDGSMADTWVEWHFAPNVFDFDAVFGPNNTNPQYLLARPGILKVNLGRLLPGTVGSFDIGLRANQNLQGGATIGNYARIYGDGPEKNKTNNEFLLQTVVPTSQAGAGSSTGAGSQNNAGNQNNSGNSGTQNNQGDNSSQNNTGNQNNTGTQNNTGGQNNQTNNNQNNQGSNNNQNNQNNESTNTENQNNQNQNTENQQNGPLPPAAEIFDAGTLQISKSNNSSGRTLARGESVTFTILVKNTTSQPIFNTVIFDTLYSPSTSETDTVPIPLDTVKAGEEVELSYDLTIGAQSAFGVYTNSAYVEGMDWGLRPVRSLSATSSFTVGAPVLPQNDNVKPDQIEEDPIIEEEAKPETLREKVARRAQELRDVQSELLGAILGQTDNNDQPPISRGPVSFANSSPASSALNQTPELLAKTGKIGSAAFTDLYSEYLAKSAAQDQPVVRAASGWKSFFNLDMLLIAFLFSIGYAVSSFREKRKKQLGKAPSLKPAHRFTSFL